MESLNLVHGGQCSCIVKILLVGGDIISWVTDCKIIHYFQIVKCSCGRKFVGKCNPRNPQILIPYKQ